MLLSGLLGAVLSASASVAREIRSGTALAVLSKPVARAQFLLAKYAGLALALALLTYLNLLAALLGSRMAYDAYGSTDKLALAIWTAFVALAYAAGGFSNYFLRRPFVADALLSLVGTATLGFVVINCLDKEGKLQAFAAGVDWRMVPAGVLILFALWMLAGWAVACSTRLEMVPTLAICSAVFLVGLMADYLFGGGAEQGTWWASALYTVTPNWQLFWLADAMEAEGAIPGAWLYVGKTFAYAVCYVGAMLAAALWLFEDRELT
jgi:ABC-type transport system involved in multi-copper enzyme maturation permease subunit